MLLTSSDEANQYLGLRFAIQIGMHISEIADILFNYGWGEGTAHRKIREFELRYYTWTKEFFGYKFTLSYWPEIKQSNNAEHISIYVHGSGNWQVRAKYMQRFYPEVSLPKYQIMDIKQMSIDVLAEIINNLNKEKDVT